MLLVTNDIKNIMETLQIVWGKPDEEKEYYSNPLHRPHASSKQFGRALS